MCACIGLLLLLACNYPTAPAVMEQYAQTATFEGKSSPREASSTIAATSTAAVVTSPQATLTDVKSVKAECLSEENNRIAQAIADDYDFTSYQEVMGWFCDGAAFEDILIALQTEELNGISAEEMLEMLSGGLSWEEIWQVIGLTD